jgi:hypothetical protein
MTEQELAWYDEAIAASDRQGGERMHPSLVIELLAEVRRLRELVEAAYKEGAFQNGPGVSEWEWENSCARKALEAA